MILYRTRIETHEEYKQMTLTVAYTTLLCNIYKDRNISIVFIHFRSCKIYQYYYAMLQYYYLRAPSFCPTPFHPILLGQVRLGQDWTRWIGRKSLDEKTLDENELNEKQVYHSYHSGNCPGTHLIKNNQLQFRFIYLNNFNLINFDKRTAVL